MSKKYNCLDEYEFLGEFWIPEDKEKKFSGIIKYTPQDGITISALLAYEEKEVINSKIFHGYSQQTGFLTLMGCFVMSEGESNFVTLSPKLFCSHLIIGGHFLIEDEFDGLSLEPSNFREFCYPQGFKLDDRYTDLAILEADLGELKISLKKTGVGTFLSSNKISSRIISYDGNAEFEAELDTATENLVNKHGIKHLSAKKDVGTEIEVTKSRGSVSDFKSYINAGLCMNALFSVLIARPSKLKYISLFKTKENKGKKYRNGFPVLSSQSISMKEMQLIENDINHRFLPVNLEDIKQRFSDILKEWGDIYYDPTDFVRSVIEENISGNPNPIQHAVVSISALEQWFNKYEGEDSAKKYDHMVDTYASKPLRDYLEECIPLIRKKNESLGKKLTDVRGLILHPNDQVLKRFKQGRQLDVCDSLNISEVIFVILLSALYTKLGVSDEAIKKLVNKGVFHKHERIEL